MHFDFSFVPNYLPYYLEGVKYTLLISLITVFFGAIFGSLLFFMKTSNFHIWKIKPLKILAVIYIEIVRGTPMLLQILIMYAGSKMFFGIDLSPFTSAIIAIALNSAAYEDNDDMDKLEIVDLKAEDDPSDIIANQEYSKTIERKIKENLSEYELSVLYEYEKGHSYADIAEKLKTKVKSVDTAIQRIKKKANKIKESIDS